MTGLAQCDVCAPLGFNHHQRSAEMALYMPQYGEYLCAHCRAEKGIADARPVIPGIYRPDGTAPVIPGVYRPRDPGWIPPGSPEHSVMISPSKVASILGVSRWESTYTLWHRMKGLVDPEPPKDIFDVGHDLEPYAANRWLRKNPGWKLSASEIQYVLPDNLFGFPVVATLDRRATRGRARRVVELKSARTMSDVEQWGDDLTGDLPEDYASQILAQMLFTGLTTYAGHCCTIGPYYQDRIYNVPYEASAADWIVTECREYMESLHSKTAPPLDDSVSTYQTVRELHPDIDGTTIGVDPELGAAVHDANINLKAADTRLRALKTRLLDAMGSAATAEMRGMPGIKVADRRPHAKGGVSLNLARTHPYDQAEMKEITA